MFHVKDDFGKGPISQVPASWFNSVGKFLNNLCGGTNVEIEKHDDGSPSVISASSGSSGITGSVSVVTGVTWNGTQLVVSHATISYVNGAIQSIVDGSDTTIDTVTYSAS